MQPVSNCKQATKTPKHKNSCTRKTAGSFCGSAFCVLVLLWPIDAKLAKHCATLLASGDGGGNLLLWSTPEQK